MADPFSYMAPAAGAAFDFKEQGSRFLARLAPCASPEEAALHLEGLKRRYHDATHACWAWRCGWGKRLRERCGDAGEPSGTAGPPILRALQDVEASDASLVVVRYFGGTKLGTGGLARAYRDAARGVIAASILVPRVLTSTLYCEMPYGAQGAFRHLAEKRGVRLSAESFGEEWAVEAAVPLASLQDFEARLVELKEAWKGGVRWKLK
jgi:uncharacterized YigZ family protein